MENVIKLSTLIKCGVNITSNPSNAHRCRQDRAEMRTQIRKETKLAAASHPVYCARMLYLAYLPPVFLLILQMPPDGVILWNPKRHHQIFGVLNLDLANGNVRLLDHVTDHAQIGGRNSR